MLFEMRRLVSLGQMIKRGLNLFAWLHRWRLYRSVSVACIMRGWSVMRSGTKGIKRIG